MFSELPIVELSVAEPRSIGALHSSEPQLRLPRWLKRNLPPGGGLHFTAELIDELGLEKVRRSRDGFPPLTYIGLEGSALGNVVHSKPDAEVSHEDHKPAEVQ